MGFSLCSISNFELNMSIDIENLSGGNYVILIEDNFGCFATDCFSINTILEPNPAIIIYAKCFAFSSIQAYKFI